MKANEGQVRLIVLTALALVAFAGNSVLCRIALKGELITADLFTVVRVLSGALALGFFSFVRERGKRAGKRGSWFGGLFLATYLVTFSWAYVSLETGAGALILFGAVQVTMVGWGLAKGERLRWSQSLGLLLALGGLTWLLLVPGTRAPSLAAGGLMLLSGVAWGGYTLRGRGSENPLRETTGNFLKAALLLAPLAVWAFVNQSGSGMGLVLALVSGVVTSAAGYAIWYEAVRGLSSTRAAGLQLLVPVLASLGGLAFGGESLTLRLVFSSLLVLGGVALVLGVKRKG